jgi:hypothetical protein
MYFSSGTYAVYEHMQYSYCRINHIELKTADQIN